MTSKTFADLEKEIEPCGCSINIIETEKEYKIIACSEKKRCKTCQAKQDLLKEVKKIIANSLDLIKEDRCIRPLDTGACGICSVCNMFDEINYELGISEEKDV